MTSIGSVTVDLLAETAQFNRNLEKSNRELQAWGAKANAGLAALEKNFNRVTRTASALGVGIGAVQLTSFARDALASAEALGDLAARAISESRSCSNTATHSASLARRRGM